MVGGMSADLSRTFRLIAMAASFASSPAPASPNFFFTACFGLIGLVVFFSMRFLMGTTSSVSALPGSQKSLELPRFKGLRIQTSCRTRSLASFSSSSRIVRPGARIVCEAPQTAVEVPAATDETWNSLVLESDCPVLVDFWAPWCGPCRVIEPVIDELAKEYTGKLKCCKVNTDESPSIATRYGIRSIPTVLIFKNGEKKGSVSGAVPKSTLTNLIEKFL